MKKSAILAGALVGVLAFFTPSCKEVDENWERYCIKYGVDPECPTEKEENYYLDCYAGSVEEEYDIAAECGCMPFSVENVSMTTRGCLGRFWYIVYTDERLGFDRRLLAVDSETYDRISIAMKNRCDMTGYLRIVNGQYTYSRHMNNENN